MGLKSRLFIIFSFIAVTSVTIAVIFAYSSSRFDNISKRLGEQSSSIRNSSQSTNDCFIRLNTLSEAVMHSKASDVSRKLFHTKEECKKTLISSSLDREIRESLIKEMEEFTSQTLEISARMQSVNSSFAGLIGTLNKISQEDKKITSTTTYILLNDLLSQVNSKVILGEQVDVPKAKFDEVVSTLSSLHTSKSIRSRLKDYVENISAVVTVWNRLIKQYDEEYNSKKKLIFQKIMESPILQFDVLVGSIAGIANTTKKYTLVAIASVPFILGLILAALYFIMRSWKMTFASLVDYCKLVKTDETKAKKAFERLNLETKTTGRQDEISLATQMIATTLEELMAFKKELELKVEERTQVLEVTQAKLFQSEKLASLGTMAAGVAHELNNPIQLIMLLSEKIKDAEEMQRNLNPVETMNEIDKQCGRMARIVSQLKRLSRSDSGKNEFNNLNSIVHNSLILLERKIEMGGVELQIDVREDVKIFCNSIHMESAISNLIQNSFEAMADSTSELAEKRILVQTYFDDNDILKLSIKDTGPGVKKELQKKIFEPFFTTKDVGKGTGLGLAIVFQTIKGMGCDLTLNSEPGHGAEFLISFHPSVVEFSNRTDKMAS